MDYSFNTIIRVSLRDILFIIFSKIYVLIGTFIIILTIAVVHTLRAKPAYRVSASILLKPYIDTRQQLIQSGGIRVVQILAEDLNNEIEIFKSRAIRERVIKELDLVRPIKASLLKSYLIKYDLAYEDNAEAVANSQLRKITISVVTKSNILKVSLKGSDPEKITNILTTYLNHYINYRIEVHKKGDSLDFFTQQAQIYNHNIKILNNKLRKYKKKWSIINIRVQKSKNLELLKLLRDQLSNFNVQIAKKQSEYTQLKNMSGQSNDVLVLTEALKESRMMIEMSKGLFPLLIETQRIALLYPEGSVEYQDAANQLRTYKEEIKNKIQQMLDGMRIDLNTLKSQEKVLKDDIKQIEDKLLLLSEKDVEYNKLINDIAEKTEIYNQYLRRTEEARINEKKNENKVSNIYVIKWPKIPTKPFYPNKKQTIMLAVLVGLISGVGSSFAAYYLDHTIKRPQDLTRNCDIAVLAALETVQQKKK